VIHLNDQSEFPRPPLTTLPVPTGHRIQGWT